MELLSGVRSLPSGLRQGAALNLPEHSSATALNQGRLSSRLPVLVPSLSHGTDNYCTFQSRDRYSANVRKKDFMINHNERDLRRPENKPGSPARPGFCSRTAQVTFLVIDYGHLS
jgi:hypothetical protein